MTSTVVSTKYIMVLHCVKQNYEKYLLIKYFYTFFFFFVWENSAFKNWYFDEIVWIYAIECTQYITLVYLPLTLEESNGCIRAKRIIL